MIAKIDFSKSNKRKVTNDKDDNKFVEKERKRLVTPHHTP
jgi:hypothetical protein